MDNDTKAELISAAAPILVPLARIAVNSHYRNKQIEQRKELEIEKARKRKEGLQQMARSPATQSRTQSRSQSHQQAATPRDDTPTTDTTDQSHQQDRLSRIDVLRERAPCPQLCPQLLDHIESLPPDEQEVALDEYLSFEEKMQEGPTADELVPIIQQSPHLKTAFQDIMESGEADPGQMLMEERG